MISLTLSQFAGAAGRGLRLAGSWLEVSRQRRKLAALDDRMLKDIGLSRATAEHEASRPFWDLPERYTKTSGRTAKGARTRPEYRSPLEQSAACGKAC